MLFHRSPPIPLPSDRYLFIIRWEGRSIQRRVLILKPVPFHRRRHGSPYPLSNPAEPFIPVHGAHSRRWMCKNVWPLPGSPWLAESWLRLRWVGTTRNADATRACHRGRAAFPVIDVFSPRREKQRRGKIGEFRLPIQLFNCTANCKRDGGKGVKSGRVDNRGQLKWRRIFLKGDTFRPGSVIFH